MKKWKAALPFAVLLPVLILQMLKLAESLQAIRAAMSSGGEAAGNAGLVVWNAVLVDPLLVAAVPTALALILWFLIRFIGKKRSSRAEKKLRDPEK